MGLKAFTEPSPSDWERWEQRLLRGEEPSEAARAEGQTCTSFRKNDSARHHDALEMSRQIRAGEDREYVRDKLRANVEQSMTSEPPRGDVANKALELLGKQAGMFDDNAHVAIEHTGTIHVEHERRLTLADVAGFARTLNGSSNGAGDELSAARPALAEPSQG